MQWKDDKQMFVGVQQVLMVTSDPSSVLIQSSVPKPSQTATKQSIKSNKTLQWLKWVDLKCNWTHHTSLTAQYLHLNNKPQVDCCLLFMHYLLIPSF